MSKKSDKEKSRELTVVVKNLDGKILTDEDLRNTVITNEMYYVHMQSIRQRLKRERASLKEEKNSTDLG